MPVNVPGGGRNNGGRKPDLSKQLARAEKLAKQLQTGLRKGLDLLAEDYPFLMGRALEAAKKGDMKVTMELIRLLPAMVKVEDDDATPMARLIQKWAVEGDVNITVQKAEPQAPPGSPDVLDAEFAVVSS